MPFILSASFFSIENVHSLLLCFLFLFTKRLVFRAVKNVFHGSSSWPRRHIGFHFVFPLFFSWLFATLSSHQRPLMQQSEVIRMEGEKKKATPICHLNKAFFCSRFQYAPLFSFSSRTAHSHPSSTFLQAIWMSPMFLPIRPLNSLCAPAVARSVLPFCVASYAFEMVVFFRRVTISFLLLSLKYSPPSEIRIVLHVPRAGLNWTLNRMELNWFEADWI